MHYTCLDPEVMDIARMRNPTTVDQKRLGEMDFSFGSNAAFADAVRENKDWMLVSVLYAPRLWELLYQPDKGKFLEEYNKVLADEKIPKKLVNARKILLAVLREAIETRQYEHFTDEMNRHTPFLDTIYSSNLCQEIFLPTSGYKQGQKGLDNVNPDEGGEIATCNLCGINVANIDGDEDYELTAYYALLMIMINILTSHYPFKQMEETSISRMSAGVSILNLAHLMAKNGMKYSDIWGKKFIHRLAETHSYFLHKAALKLGKEFGNAKWIGKTKYPSGWLPIDTRNEKAKAIAHQPLKRDWETLRKEIVENGGIAFSVLETAVPSESSSIAQDSCNGLYPIREGIITKKDGKKVVQWIAPQWEELQDKYEKAFTISTKDMTDLYSIVQCFTGQGISADYYMAHKRDENGKIVVSGKQLIKDWLYRQEMGMKSRYYINHSTNGVYQQAESISCSSGGCTL
jgi:ribonucleoside-diphosphate reductase alpha chain